MARKKILIIEDSIEIVKVMEIRLKSTGFDTVVAYDGAKGWEMVKNENPDLVILDLILPVVDGYEVCKLIKGNKQTEKIPVLIVSAKAMIKDLDKGFGVGADDYIIKPYDWDNLLTKIHKLL